MDFSLFLRSAESFYLDQSFKKGSLGSNVVNYQDELDLSEFQIAIIGVLETRGASRPYNMDSGLAKFRKAFGEMFSHSSGARIVDMGDILPGNEAKDSYFALGEVVKALIKADVIPMIIGGTQDLTYGNYLAYEGLEQSVNLVTVDSRIDIGMLEDEVNDENYMNKIIMHQPNYLFNYSCIGYQSYFVHPDLLALMEKLYFDAYRLGKVREDLSEVEPVMRGADVVSIDLTALKVSEGAGTCAFSPNGFTGADLCQIARYAGISDKVTSFGVFNYSPDEDQKGVGAMLLAQICWYFIEGFLSRVGDYPVASMSKYTKYRVLVDEETPELSFYKSDKSGRWWIEVPHPENTKFKHERHTYMSCSYQDYQEALKGEIPERWWQAYQKML